MIYVTGDTHAQSHRFNTDNFPEQKEMTKDDYVIICGDFGGVWHREDSEYIKQENYWLDWLDDKPFTTLFVDGNHSNFDRLYQFSVEQWHGGNVHKIRPSVIHLMRGEIFDIDGKSVFAFGGASSHDIDDGILEPSDYKNTRELWKEYNRLTGLCKMIRVNHYSWWKQEMPDDDEIDNGIRNLTDHNDKVDFIITHCAPQAIASYISAGEYKADRLTAILDMFREETSYEHWFFGHYHKDIWNLPDRTHLLYKDIIKVN